MSKKPLTSLLNEFLSSEKAGGFVLIACTLISLLVANSAAGDAYLGIWHAPVFGEAVEYWINDGLMTIFFLLVGLELKREVLAGELSTVRKSLLPIFAAAGGMIIPAGVYYLINKDGAATDGTGIPMATDIAFALGILSLLGSRVPAGLKIFLTALAVIDDLGAILVIAIFYTSDLVLDNLAISLAIWGGLFLLQRLKVRFLLIYLLGGAAMWYFMLHSGVHATITGVLLAFVIPFNKDDSLSLSYKLQHWLHKPVAFIILPVFALANTGIILETGWAQGLSSPMGLGIIGGLVVGKPLGILIFSAIAVLTGLSQLPSGVNWKHVAGAGMLAGIGFTMSIFISLLAFTDSQLVISAKIAILCASLLAAVAGLVWLALTSGKRTAENDRP
ncbi:MAG: Na+/H+ antiporter NhaA [Chitinophagaceae bacterium]|nr:MAG: Na+/H+ antiporter NhaA [Chitinophagaceae bacterium]